LEETSHSLVTHHPVRMLMFYLWNKNL